MSEDLMNYLRWLKANTKEEEYREIVNMADDDIKFNNFSFGRRTSPAHYIAVCKRCHKILLNANEGLNNE